jgi:hypothetical protein
MSTTKQDQNDKSIPVGGNRYHLDGEEVPPDKPRGLACRHPEKSFASEK